MQKWLSVVSIIVLYNVLFHVYKVSRDSEKRCQGRKEFLQDLRDYGSNSAKTDAGDIAERLQGEMS